MASLIPVLVCVMLIVALAYFAVACAYEAGLAVVRRLPDPVRVRMNRMITVNLRTLL
ncbi:MAG: hypothetical protein KME04_13435 [Pleurocapsa minor GSE-CHR-MK-17-07R]|jgi:hypothetical protein|nr:hypothetical protein [Pleurocapsa minor GSE-CHR-MK 17-07R]